MNLTAGKKILYFVLFLCFAVGIGAASVYDLKISSHLSELSGSGAGLTLNVPSYAKVLEILGEWPAVLLCSVAVLILAAVLAEKHPSQALFIRIFSPLPVAVLAAYGCMKTAEHLTGTLSTRDMLFVAVGAAMITLLLSLIVSCVPQETKRRLFLPAAATLAAACAILIVTSGIKVVWGRIRLRELVAAGSLDGFTPWYRPNFFSGSHSFPSGHTAHNTLTLMLPLWARTKKCRIALWTLSALWIIAMAFSRLAAGAHYLSDVLFGFLIAFVITEIARHACEKRVQSSPK